MHDKQTSTRPPTSHIAPFGLRMQPELRAALEEAARENGRSLNAEIAYRLEESLRPSKPAQQAAERRKLELVTAYLDWCQSKGETPEKSYAEFCDFYNDPEREHGGVPNIQGIPHITQDYLSELHGVWFLEREAPHPHQATDVSYIMEVLEAKLEAKLDAREQALLYKVEQIAKRSEE